MYFLNLYTLLKIRWITFRYSKKMWWGENLDVRFKLIELLKRIKNKTVLDVGCNYGLILSQMDKSNQLTGIDINSELIDIGKKTFKNINFINQDLFNINTFNIKYDVIILSCIIDILPKEKRKDCLVIASKLLNKNGVLYIATLNSRYFNNPNKVDYAEYNEYLEELFEHDTFGYYYGIKIPNIKLPFLKNIIGRSSIPLIPSFLLAMIPFIRTYFNYASKNKPIDQQRYFYSIAKLKKEN